MAEDQALIAEIQALEEQVLSDSFSDTADGSYSYCDEEFLDFILPLEEDHNSVQARSTLWT